MQLPRPPAPIVGAIKKEQIKIYEEALVGNIKLQAADEDSFRKVRPLFAYALVASLLLPCDETNRRGVVVASPQAALQVRMMHEVKCDANGDLGCNCKAFWHHRVRIFYSLASWPNAPLP